MSTEKLRFTSDQDAHLAARTLHDAELIRGGAVYTHGRLEVTGAQRLALSGQSPRSLGVMALLSDEEERLLKPVEELIAETENRAALTRAIESQTEPYVGVFAEYVPRPANTRPSRFGKKAKDQFTDLPAKQKLMGTIAAEINMSLTYAPRETAYRLKQALLTIDEKSNGEFPRVLTAMYEYANGRVAKIAIHLKGARTMGSDRFNAVFPSGSNGFGDLLQLTSGFATGATMMLGDEKAEPSIRIENAMRSGENFEYRYDAARNAFRLLGPKKVGRGDELRPDTISNEQFLDALSGLLKLIPAQELA